MCVCYAAMLPSRGFARSPRAAGLGANSGVSATQHGAKCGVQFVARSGEGSRGATGARCEGSMMDGLRTQSPLLCISVGAVWPWGAWQGEGVR